MPVMGTIPMVMPTFWNSWNTIMANTPDAQQRPEVVAGQLRGTNDPHGEKGEQRQHGHRADEAQLLADDGEDEVGLLLGHQVVLGLVALAVALAGDSTQPDGDLGLFEVERLGLAPRRPHPRR